MTARSTPSIFRSGATFPTAAVPGGKVSCAFRNAWTTAKAEPVAVKVSNSRLIAWRTPPSGSRTGFAAAVAGQPDRQLQPQVAAGGLGQDPAAQAGPQEMQFCLAELAFHAQEEPVVETGRVDIARPRPG